MQIECERRSQVPKAAVGGSPKSRCDLQASLAQAVTLAHSRSCSG